MPHKPLFIQVISTFFGDGGMPGVFFTYELAPMMVKYSEKQKSLGHFLSNLCAIIGGVFTVSGKWIYSSHIFLYLFSQKVFIFSRFQMKFLNSHPFLLVLKKNTVSWCTWIMNIYCWYQDCWTSWSMHREICCNEKRNWGKVDRNISCKLVVKTEFCTILYIKRSKVFFSNNAFVLYKNRASLLNCYSPWFLRFLVVLTLKTNYS